MRRIVLILVFLIASTLFFIKVSARTPVLNFVTTASGLIDAGCNIQDINTTIAAATGGTTDYTDGDVVFLKPDCVSLWTGGTPVNVTKAITLAGNGFCINCGTPTPTYTGSTNITTNMSITDHIRLAQINSRVTGFTITDITVSGCGSICDHDINAKGSKWRIDNMQFINGGTKDTLVATFQSNADPVVDKTILANGLIDHIIYNKMRNYYQADPNDNPFGNRAWQVPSGAPVLTLGNQYNGTNAPIVYIENVSCLVPTPNSTNNCSDEQYGARAVMRFSYLLNTHPEMHSMQSNDRATRSMEFYANTLEATGTGCHNLGALIRGGVPIFFSNSLIGTAWCSGNPFNLENARSFQSKAAGGTSQGSCSGLPGTEGSTWDENQVGQLGYRCRDQIGASDDTDTFPPFGSAQLVQPGLFANNFKNSSSNQPSITNCVGPNVSNPVKTYPTSPGITPSTAGSCHDIHAGIEFLTSVSSTNTITVGTGVPAGPCTSGNYYLSTDQGSWDSTGTHKEVIYKCTASTWALFYTPYQYPHPLDNVNHISLETAADGTGSAVGAITLSSGATVTIYPIVRSSTGAFVSNEAATWKLGYITGGVVNGDLAVAGNTKSAVFTGNATGSVYVGVLDSSNNATTTGLITVNATGVTSIETAADGSGSVLGGNVTSGTSVTGYSISRTTGGTFIANVACTWSLANKSGGVVDSDLAVAGDSKSATFTGHLIGSANMHCIDATDQEANSALLNVIVGTATSTNVETAPDGTGVMVPLQTIAQGQTVNAYSISRDSSNNFIANVAATWSLTSKTGGVVNGDLVAASDGKSATFTGNAAGSAKITALANALTGNSGTITVAPGTITVETAANGTGTIVPPQAIAPATTITAYSISRNGVGQFISNIASTWSLTNITGGVVNGDLVAAVDGKSAVFTGNAAGSATISATNSTGTGVSGTIVVTTSGVTIDKNTTFQTMTGWENNNADFFFQFAANKTAFNTGGTAFWSDLSTAVDCADGGTNTTIITGGTFSATIVNHPIFISNNVSGTGSTNFIKGQYNVVSRTDATHIKLNVCPVTAGTAGASGVAATLDNYIQYNQAYQTYRDTAMSQLCALGMDRVVINMLGYGESGTDYWPGTVSFNYPIQAAVGGFNSVVGVVVNDNADPNVVNTAGYQFKRLDDEMDGVVMPYKRACAAVGIPLIVRLTYQNFSATTGSPTIYTTASPAGSECGELWYAVIQHLQQKYAGFTPNYLSVINEPDNSSTEWSATQGTAEGQCIKAAGDRLATLGVTAHFVAANTENVQDAVTYINNIAAVSGASAYIDSYGFHKYPGSSYTNSALQAIYTAASSHGSGVEMTECQHNSGCPYTGTPTFNQPAIVDLMNDLVQDRARAWNWNGVINSTGANTSAIYLVTYPALYPTSPQLPADPINEVRLLRQVTAYVRQGATRISATSSNADITSVAFINPAGPTISGGKTVVVSYTDTAVNSFIVGPLPVGIYGTNFAYNDFSLYNQNLPDQKVAEGGFITVNACALKACTVTVYGKREAVGKLK